CGTRDGITACQMDIKVNGLSSQIMSEALEQAKAGRLHILSIMEEAISEPREDYKPFVPRIVKLVIPKEFIGAVIGPGGKIIQEMQRETNTVINIEEKDGVGIIDIASANLENVEAAIKRIKAITTVPEVGEIYEGKVKSITAFGAFIEILPNVDALLHVSEIAYKRVENVEDVLKVGDEIRVKLIAIDEKTGKYKLSHKVLLEKPEGWVDAPPRAPRPEGDRPRREGGRDSRDGGRDRRDSGRDNRDRRNGDRRDSRN
ncbi:MAG TPA: S1 RNA-binding domain-containing protein, partial [Bacteroidales bacterium]|nr:S1 RNA-binding domain-containing protein [Bacteroidales bacterium]